jgi:sRNA-binding carbon storage regulator CsrA
MRGKGESIFIYPREIPEGMTAAELFSGRPIKLKIAETHSAQCKLGIEAPKQLAIVREELI